MAEPKPLNLPAARSVKYARNFIGTAVCELRFPTLLELERTPPTKFQGNIRKTYPFFEKQTVEELGSPAGPSREVRYLFRSKDQNWTVVVKSFALALETTKYEQFETFFPRLSEILKSGEEMIDADFFTRVGLRYVNSIPIEDGNVDGWIKSDLIQPLTSGALGTPQRYSAIIQGHSQEGQYSIRHGLKTSEDGKNAGLAYTLDFDHYAENVELGKVLPLVKQFHETNFTLFSWCIGEKAKTLLGQGKPK